MPSREVRVAIIGDPSSLQRALRTADGGLNTFGRRMESFGTRMRAVGSTMTRGLTLPLVGFGILAARELSAGERALAQTQAVIESTGGAANKSVQDILELSSALSEMSSVDDEPIQEMANTLLTFRNIAGDTFDEATAATLDLSIAMDRDLRTSAVLVGKALNDPIRGMTALRRVGVDFTDEWRDTGYTMEQAIAWMVEMGDTAGAQQVILEELNQEFGGSAEALGGTLTGRLQRLKNQFEELGATILEDLIPVFEDMASIVTTLAEAYGRLTPEQQKWVAFALLALAVAGPLASIMGVLATAIGAVAGALTAVGATAGLIIVAFAALAGALIFAYQNWNTVNAGIQSFLSLMRNIPGVATLIMIVGKNVQLVIGFWRTLISLVQSAIGVLRSVGEITLGGLVSAFQALLSAVNAVLNGVRALASAIASLPSIPSLTGGSILQDSGYVPESGTFIPESATGRSSPGRSGGAGGGSLEMAFRRALREEMQLVRVVN